MLNCLQEIKCISTSLTRNLMNFFILSNVILEIIINSFAHFLFYSHPSFDDGIARSRWGSLKKKIISDWFIIIIGHRLLLELHRIVIQNESWRAKQKSQRITVLLPWSPQFPLWKPSPILIFLSVRQRFLIPIILIKISSGIKIIIIAINSIHFLKFIYSFFFP